LNVEVDMRRTAYQVGRLVCKCAKLAAPVTD
jgi:hypothetical protein